VWHLLFRTYRTDISDNEIKYCPNCGTKLPTHASYCHECGAEQSDTGARTEQTVQPPAEQEQSTQIELTESERQQIRGASEPEAFKQSIIERKRKEQQNSSERTHSGSQADVDERTETPYSVSQFVSFFGVLLAVGGALMPWIRFDIIELASTSIAGTELIGGLLVVTLALLGGAATGVSTHGWSGGASYAVFFLGIGVVSTCGLHAIDAFVLEVYE